MLVAYSTEIPYPGNVLMLPFVTVVSDVLMLPFVTMLTRLGHCMLC
jgi:hypothetical protein